MSKLDWIATECAPKNFPVKIVSGLLYFEDGSSTYVPPGKVIHNGWGEIGSIHLSEQIDLPFPVKIYILWFSYRENKFFECEADLPETEIKNIMETGFSEPLSVNKVKADKIIVGLAPGGDVILWAAAAGVVVEMVAFKALEVKYKWRQFLNNNSLSRNDYVEMILKEKLGEIEFKKSLQVAVPAGKWASFREKFCWTPRVVVLSDNIRLWVKKFNGERIYYNTKDLSSLNEKEETALPEEINISYVNFEGKHFELMLRFKEEIIFKAFKKMASISPKETLRIVIEINDAAHQVLVFLANEVSYIVISPSEINKFKSESP